MAYIKVEKIQTYAYHGCMDEEAKVGTPYEIDITVKTDIKKSAETDELIDTVDYVTINKIVYEEMAIRAKLIEVVAVRILKRVQEIPLVESSKIALSKINAPIGGQVDRVTLILESNEL